MPSRVQMKPFPACHHWRIGLPALAFAIALAAIELAMLHDELDSWVANLLKFVGLAIVGLIATGYLRYGQTLGPERSTGSRFTGSKTSASAPTHQPVRCRSIRLDRPKP